MSRESRDAPSEREQVEYTPDRVSFVGGNGYPQKMDAIVVLEDRSMSVYNYRTSAEVVERGRYHDDLVPKSDQLTR